MSPPGSAADKPRVAWEFLEDVTRRATWEAHCGGAGPALPLSPGCTTPAALSGLSSSEPPTEELFVPLCSWSTEKRDIFPVPTKSWGLGLRGVTLAGDSGVKLVCGALQGTGFLGLLLA